jgi:cytochrome P450
MGARTFDFPGSRGGCPFSPSAELAAFAKDTSVGRITLWDGSQAWLVTRHADVRAVLRDSRFSSAVHHPGFPWINDGLKAQCTVGPPPFVRLDGPEHARVRNLLTGHFTPRRVEDLRPRIQRIVDDCLDRVISPGPPADLLAELARPLPSLVICELLGIDYDDHEFFQERSATLLQTSVESTRLAQALDELIGYLTELIERRRRDPDNGIVSQLAAGSDLTDAEIAITSMFLLIAGHETTTNQSGISVLALLCNPDQLSLLRTNPALIKGAVDELLRYASIVHSGAPRVATEDVVVGGRHIASGEGVLCVLDTANHDERAFAAPERLDVTREARSHVAFGFGVHQCLGQSLARVELQVILDTLIRRLPGLRLAVPFGELQFNESGAAYGLEELPVQW